MNKASLIAAAALAVAVAACSKEPAAEQSKQGEAGGSVSAEEISPKPAAEENAIPEMLRGRWGLVPADCTSTRGDAKGLLTITADKLEFYESVATLGPIREVDADSIGASFDFTGEGETWIQEVALSTPDGGKTLVREDMGPRAQPGPFTYTKCPAG